jgi:hypothetical protein
MAQMLVGLRLIIGSAQRTAVFVPIGVAHPLSLVWRLRPAVVIFPFMRSDFRSCTLNDGTPVLPYIESEFKYQPEGK